MKNKGILKFFIVFGLILAICATAFVGIGVRFGDNVETYIKGIGNIHWGIDLNGGKEMTLSPKGDITDEQLKEAVSVIKQRITDMSLNDYLVDVDENKKEITVRVPENTANGLTADVIFYNLSVPGNLRFIKGEELDDQGKPTGEVILTGKNIVSAEPMYTESGSYIVTVTFDEEGKELFAKATEEMAKTKGALGVWMDDTFVTGATVTTAITDGVVSLSGSNFNSESVTNLAKQISIGALPYEVTASEAVDFAPLMGENAKTAAIAALAAGLVAVIVFLVLAYRLVGVCAGIALLGQTAGIVMVFTGYINAFDGIIVNKAAVLGAAASLVLGAVCSAAAAQHIKNSLTNGQGLVFAIKSGFSAGLKNAMDLGAAAAVVGIVLMAAFGTVDNFFTILFSPVMFFIKADANSALYTFGYMLVAGVILSLVFSVVACRIMVKSLSQIKGLNSNALYGGKKNA